MEKKGLKCNLNLSGREKLFQNVSTHGKESNSAQQNQLKVVWSRRISKKKKSFLKSGKRRASESKRSKFSAKS